MKGRLANDIKGILDVWKSTDSARKVNTFALILIIGFPFAILVRSWAWPHVYTEIVTLLVLCYWLVVSKRWRYFPWRLGKKLYAFHPTACLLVNSLLLLLIGYLFLPVVKLIGVLGGVFAAFVVVQVGTVVTNGPRGKGDGGN